MKKFTKQEFIENAIKIHGDKYDYSLVEYVNSKIKVKIICSEHGVFEQKPIKHVNGSQGCPNCNSSFKRTNEQFIIEARNIHGDKYDYSFVSYKNTDSKVKIICQKHGEFLQSPYTHLKGSECSKCKRVRKLTTEEFIQRVKKIHNNKYDYSLVKYIGSRTKVKIICKEHGIFEQIPSGHLDGKGCLSCSGYKKLTTEDFFRRANEIHEWKYDYSLVKYNNHYEKVEIICQKHGKFIQGAGSHLAGVGCPHCCESKGEKIINSWLLKEGINFQRQKTFNNCKFKGQLYFDFYLPDYNLCIEYDGLQHFKPIKHFGGDENFYLIKKRDKIKNKFCDKHNIELLRISYKDNVIKILEDWIKEQ